jgi:hypothetical protein
MPSFVFSLSIMFASYTPVYNSPALVQASYQICLVTATNGLMEYTFELNKKMLVTFVVYGKRLLFFCRLFSTTVPSLHFSWNGRARMLHKEGTFVL